MDLSNPALWLQVGSSIAVGGAIYGGIRAELRFLARRVTRLENRIDRDSRIMTFVRKEIRDTLSGELDSRPQR